MNQVIVYSTHHYTKSILNRLNELSVTTTDPLNEQSFFNELSENEFDLIIIDSSNEESIFKIIERIQNFELNKHTSILFLIPGTISYQQNIITAGERAILGMSKPFSPKQFNNISKFLIQKKLQHNKLVSSLKNLQQFTVMASHDLKTPIKNIYSYADIALEEIKEIDSSENEEIVEYIEIIKNESKRMINFVSDMFDFSNAGHPTFIIEEFSLETLVSDLSNMLQKDYNKKSIKFELNLFQNLVKADKSKLSHIFQNLIDNAMKYSEESRPLSIKISSERSSPIETIFCVEDSGSGIRSEDVHKIFEPFKRGLSKEKGSGIGLAIVQQLIEAHGGRIWVETELNKGSKFFFTIQDLRGVFENAAA